MIWVAVRPFVLVLKVRPESSSIVFASVKNAIRLFVAVVPPTPVPPIVPVPKLVDELSNPAKSILPLVNFFWLPELSTTAKKSPSPSVVEVARESKSRLNV